MAKDGDSLGKNPAAQALGRRRWLKVDAPGRSAAARVAVKAREQKRARARRAIEQRLPADLAARLREAAHAHHPRDAYAAIAEAQIDALACDRTMLRAWDGRSVSRALRAMLGAAEVVDLIPTKYRRAFLAGLKRAMHRDARDQWLARL